MRCDVWIILMLVLTSVLPESDYPISTVSTSTDGLSPTWLARTDPFDLVLSLKRFQQKTISALTHVWTALPQWNKTTLSDISTSMLDISTSAITTSTSALSLALNTGLQLFKELSHSVIDYCVRITLYLQAAYIYEERLHGKSKSDDSNQQTSNTAVALLTPHQRQEAIGRIAGLQPEEIPQLAILLERANRKIDG